MNVKKENSFHVIKSHKTNIKSKRQTLSNNFLFQTDYQSGTLLTVLLSLSFLKIMCTRQVLENNAPNSVVKPIHIIHTLICNRKKTCGVLLL